MSEHGFLVTEFSGDVHACSAVAVDRVVVSAVQHQLENTRNVIVLRRKMKWSRVSDVRIHCNTQRSTQSYRSPHRKKSQTFPGEIAGHMSNKRTFINANSP